ncbi:helix-turn-helix domain-containing protein [Paracoccus kondratievae]
MRLDQTGWNRSAAAVSIRISRSTVGKRTQASRTAFIRPTERTAP